MTPCRAALMLFVLPFLPGLAAAAPEGKIVIAQGVDPTTLDPQWHEEQMDLYGVNKRVNFQALSSEQLVGVWMSLRGGK